MARLITKEKIMSLSKLFFIISAVLFFLSAIAADFLSLSGRRDEWAFLALALGFVFDGWLFPAR